PVMRVAQTTSTVEVVEATPLVTTDNPTLGRVLERTRIEQLPINGRSVTSLLVTIPGMEGNRAYGMREGSQELVLDGADLTDRFLGGDPYRLPSLESMQEFKVENNSSSAKFARPTSIVLSTKSGTNAFHGSLLETHRNNAIGKARRREDYYTKPPHLIRNEFGGSAGGPVIIPHLYNGTNRTFWFFAYEGNRAITATTKSYHVPTEAFRKGDFTGLVDAQGRLLQLYDPMTTDSTTWARQSFSYGGRNNVIDPARISPLAKQLFAITPLPTLPQVNPLIDYNWWGPVPNITRQWTTTARFDHRLSDKDNLYARYTQGDSYNFSDFLSQPMLNNVAGTKRVLQPNRSLALSHTHVFSPSFFHELLLSASRSKLFIGTGEPGVKYNEQLGLPNPFDVAGWPGIYNTGLSTYYFETENTQQTPFTNYVADSNFTKITGKHELQFGGHFRIDQLNYMPEQQQIQGNDNFYTFATSLYDPASSRTNPLATSLSGHQLANMFLGVANYGNNFVRGYFYARAKEYAGYFQDNYRVNSRLTLNFGLRWEYWPPYSEKRGVLTSFDPQKKAIVLGSSVDNLYQLGATMPKIVNTYTQMGAKFMTYDEAGLPRDLMNGNSANFGPRIGFAYRLSEGKSPTVLRGGYRISYFPVPLSTWGRRMRMNAPLTAPFLNYMILPETSPDGIANLGLRSVPTIIAGQNSTKAVTIDSKVSLSRGSATVSYFNPDQPDSRPMDWNLTLERQVAHSTVVKASYVGNHVDNLEMYYRYNEAPTTYLWYVNTGLAVPTGEYSAVARRPFDQQVYGTIEEYQKTGWSNYHGMQFEIERRYSNGLAFQVFYNLGNAMTAGGRSYSAVIYGLNQYLPGAVPTDLQERSRFLNYQRDTTIPRQRLRWNWVADLPFGKGKRFAGNASGLLDKIVGGWQLTGLGYLRTTDWALPTNIYPTGDAIELYGEKYPIQDCRGGTCVSGYLYWNGYIPSNRINSYDADGKPNGVMGVPSDYKPAGAPLIPWGSTTLPANAPANTNISSFWGTNTVWVKLKDGSVQRTTYDNNLHPWRQQYFPGPRSWGMDASLVKNVPIHESISLRVSADLFNVLNHPNNSSGITGEGLMVTRTSGVAARELQVGMRLTW
ncbi:MAG TPA: TonB-dependent receptor, partial [Bryobacteraceae bacterium]|nr:TonB-dependent receptor [Bryobacteraceae bacterium]